MRAPYKEVRQPSRTPPATMLRVVQPGRDPNRPCIPQFLITHFHPVMQVACKQLGDAEEQHLPVLEKHVRGCWVADAGGWGANPPKTTSLQGEQ